MPILLRARRTTGARSRFAGLALRALAGAVVVCLLLGSVPSAAQPVHDLPRPADRVPLATQSLVLDIVRTPRNWVAVGERGHILLSEDGQNWEQAQFVPAQSTLTRVTYTSQRLWAVGHDSTILHSYDYGQTWALQHFEPAWEKPLMDVHFFDRDNGLAIGAFGLIMRTSDAGRNWTILDMADLVVSEAIDWEAAAQDMAEDDWRDDDWEDEDFAADDDVWLDDDFDEDDDFGFDQGCYQFMECHLNAFVDLGDGRQMIVAERGFGFRSTDSGETWEAFMFPYQGSMFGVLAGAGGRIVAFGLRGFVQISEDFGDEWEILDFGLRATLKGGVALDANRVLLVGSGATRLTLDTRTGSGDLREDRLGSDFVAVAIGPDGRIILGGADGLSYE
ncbi:MAG: WD40/YVTN/BNR-like repeat-containing protein [Wenzhouxiangella sp.]